MATDRRKTSRLKGMVREMTSGSEELGRKMLWCLIGGGGGGGGSRPWGWGGVWWGVDWGWGGGSVWAAVPEEGMSLCVYLCVYPSSNNDSYLLREGQVGTLGLLSVFTAERNNGGREGGDRKKG